MGAGSSNADGPGRLQEQVDGDFAGGPYEVIANALKTMIAKAGEQQ